jgi:hypothetical protein
MTVAEVAAVVGPVAADLATVKIRELYRSRPEAETEKVLAPSWCYLLLLDISGSVLLLGYPFRNCQVADCVWVHCDPVDPAVLLSGHAAGTGGGTGTGTAAAHCIVVQFLDPVLNPISASLLRRALLAGNMGCSRQQRPRAITWIRSSDAGTAGMLLLLV